MALYTFMIDFTEIWRKTKICTIIKSAQVWEMWASEENFQYLLLARISELTMFL